MQLYFIPFACSLAARIVAEEAGLALDYVPVDQAKRLPDGSDFRAINPLGYVPVLIDQGRVLMEAPVVLEHLADRAGRGDLAGGEDRAGVRQWLHFVATELHQLSFHPIMAADATDGSRAWGRAQGAARLAWLDPLLATRETLLDTFTIADAYLLAVLNWAETAGYDLARYPGVLAWRTRMRRRPSVARAAAAELPLLRAA